MEEYEDVRRNIAEKVSCDLRSRTGVKSDIVSMSYTVTYWQDFCL